LEQRISYLEEENSFLKRYNEKLKIDADCIELGPKIQNSFYQNIFINDMKKDISHSNEELQKYRGRITELENLNEKLQEKNEYLVKLVNKYRAMVPKKSQNLTPILNEKNSISKVSRHRLKSSSDFESFFIDSKESNSSIIKPTLMHNSKYEFLLSKGATGHINILEQLHSIISVFDNCHEVTE
jgi:predicted RNase H-like nuclease (RuvC/YqgF family)